VTPENWAALRRAMTIAHHNATDAAERERANGEPGVAVLAKLQATCYESILDYMTDLEAGRIPLDGKAVKP
jgi:hypothetical protein